MYLEAAYIDSGHPGDTFRTSGSDGVYHASMTGFSPAVLGIIPIGPVELFGKAGHYFYDLDTRVDFTSGPFLESRHSRSDFLYGGGLGVTLFQHLNVRAEYECIDVTNASGSDAFWPSPSWRFQECALERAAQSTAESDYANVAATRQGKRGRYRRGSMRPADFGHA